MVHPPFPALNPRSSQITLKLFCAPFAGEGQRPHVGVTVKKSGNFDLWRIIENLRKKNPSHVLASARQKVHGMRCSAHGKTPTLSLKEEAGQSALVITACCEKFQNAVAQRVFHE